MKNRLLPLCLLAVLFIGCVGCSDLIDKKLSDTQMVVYNPSDSFVTSYYTVVFQWEQVNGASRYRLQIASPNFNNMQQLVLDSAVTGTKFSATLSPGIYQWRIRAENGSSSTPYVVRNIRVDTTSNLSGQTFITSFPADNKVLPKTVVNFVWPAFPFATQYELYVTDSNSAVVIDQLTTQTNLVDTLAEGVYYWKARAKNENNNTMTNFSDAKKLIIDLTAPNVSVPKTPLNNSIDTNGVILTWSRSADAIQDSVLVASDSTFQHLVFNALASNTNILLPALTVNSKYYWRLRSIDAGGNWSGYSIVFSFSIH